MFTPDQRARIRADLLEHATYDPRITAAAINGSAAADTEDKWSDIDLAFGLANPADQQAVLSDWTSYMVSGVRDHARSLVFGTAFPLPTAAGSINCQPKQPPNLKPL